MEAIEGTTNDNTTLEKDIPNIEAEDYSGVPSPDDLAVVIEAVLKIGLETNGHPLHSLISPTEVGLMANTLMQDYHAKYKTKHPQEDVITDTTTTTTTTTTLTEENPKVKVEEEKEKVTSEIPNQDEKEEGERTKGEEEEKADSRLEETEASSCELKERMIAYNMLARLVGFHLTAKTHFRNLLREIVGFHVPSFTSGGYSYHSASVFNGVHQFYAGSVRELEGKLGKSSGGHLFLHYPTMVEVPRLLTLFFDGVPPLVMSNNALVTSFLAIGSHLCEKASEFEKSFFTALAYVSFSENWFDGHSYKFRMSNHHVPNSVFCSAAYSHDNFKDSLGPEVFPVFVTEVSKRAKEVEESSSNDHENFNLDGDNVTVSLNEHVFFPPTNGSDGSSNVDVEGEKEEKSSPSGLATTVEHQDFGDEKMEGIHRYRFLLHLALARKLREIERECKRDILAAAPRFFTEGILRPDLKVPVNRKPKHEKDAKKKEQVAEMELSAKTMELYEKVEALYCGTDSWQILLKNIFSRSPPWAKQAGQKEKGDPRDEKRENSFIEETEERLKMASVKSLDAFQKWLVCLMNQNARAMTKVLAETNFQYIAKRYDNGKDTMSDKGSLPWFLSLDRYYEMVVLETKEVLLNPSPTEEKDSKEKENKAIDDVGVPKLEKEEKEKKKTEPDDAVDGEVNDGCNVEPEPDLSLPWSTLREQMLQCYKPQFVASAPLVKKTWDRTVDIGRDLYLRHHLSELGLPGGNIEDFLSTAQGRINEYQIDLVDAVEKANTTVDEKEDALQVETDPFEDYEKMKLKREKKEEAAAELVRDDAFVEICHPYYFNLNATALLGVAHSDEFACELFSRVLVQPLVESEKAGARKCEGDTLDTPRDSDPPKEPGSRGGISNADARVFFENLCPPEEIANVWHNFTTRGYLHLKLKDHRDYVNKMHYYLCDKTNAVREKNVSCKVENRLGVVDWLNVYSEEDLKRQRCYWFKCNDWISHTSDYVKYLKRECENNSELAKLLGQEQRRWYADLTLPEGVNAHVVDVDEVRVIEQQKDGEEDFPILHSFKSWLLSLSTEKHALSLLE
jgi:hypothetical protein